MLNNIRVFFQDFFKKYKLQIAVLGFSMVLSGCGSNMLDIYNKDYNENSDNQTDNSESPFDDEYSDLDISSIEKKDIDEQLYLKILNSNFSIDSNSQSQFTDIVSNIDVDYEYSEMFGIDEFLNRYNNKKEINNVITGFDSIIVNGNVNLDKLINRVNLNNAKYLEDNSGIAKKFSGTTDELVRNTCKEIANYLNGYSKKNPELDMELLNVKLNGLKIFKSETFNYGYYNADTGIMGLNSQMFENLRESYNDEIADKKVIQHETNHILQGPTIEELLNSDYIFRIGPCYEFDDLKINCGYWNWYFEAAAENMTCRYNDNCSPMTYLNDIACMKIVESAKLINDKNYINKFCDLSLESDLGVIFDYFNCKNDSDRKEVIKLMYSFNIINQDHNNSSTRDFYDLYKEMNGSIMDYGSRYILNYNLYGSISQSLSKYFYSDLTNHLTDKNVNIEEVFCNIYAMEQNLYRLTKYTQKSRIDNNYDFFANYTFIQDGFFEIISNSTGIDVESIKVAYYRYCTNTGKEIKNISYLNEEKNKYYQDVINNSRSLNSSCISEYYDLLKIAGVYDKINSN